MEAFSHGLNQILNGASVEDTPDPGLNRTGLRMLEYASGIIRYRDKSFKILKI
jgi:hypothetical protein